MFDRSKHRCMNTTSSISGGGGGRASIWSHVVMTRGFREGVGSMPRISGHAHDALKLLMFRFHAFIHPLHMGEPFLEIILSVYLLGVDFLGEVFFHAILKLMTQFLLVEVRGGTVQQCNGRGTSRHLPRPSPDSCIPESRTIYIFYVHVFVCCSGWTAVPVDVSSPVHIHLTQLPSSPISLVWQVSS
jgi:hypothetical protein